MWCVPDASDKLETMAQHETDRVRCDVVCLLADEFVVVARIEQLGDPSVRLCARLQHLS